MFFSSWALWEKMTFVLALAIVGVFAIGWGKLVWRNQYVKRQALVDEEKKMKIQELRNNGHTIQSRKNHDIPFGVRAIQSGIQVDGIWISQSATPVPSELKLGHLRRSSSENVTSDDSDKIGGPLIDSSPETSFTSTNVQAPQLRVRTPSNAPDGHSLGQQEMGGAPQDYAATRPSYKPQRSSHLRFGSYGEYDEETLDHLEGRMSPTRKKAVSHRPRGSLQTETEADSSAADNEQNSGTSDDSDATLSHNNISKIDGPHQSLLHRTINREAVSSLSTIPPSNSIQESVPTQSLRTEYISIPNQSPEHERTNPFSTPSESPLEAPRSLQPGSNTTRQSWLENAAAEPSHRPSPSPFVPGELHVNKTVRKVNSGFEVLPAGTFGLPSEFRGKGVEVGDEEDSGDRRQSGKLQKRPRNSVSGKRPPSTLEYS